MPRHREFDEHDVLERAVPVFWRSGFGGTSIEDIVKATGVNRYGLYVAFGEKHELFARVMDHYSRTVIDSLLGPMERPGAGKAEIRRYFEMLIDSIENPDGRLGCLIGNASIEITAPHESISFRINSHFERMRKAFLHALEEEYRANAGYVPDIPALADFLVGVASGYIVAVKSGRSPSRIRAFLETSYELLP